MRRRRLRNLPPHRGRTVVSVYVVGLDPLKDSRHRNAAAARDLADWLQYHELQAHLALKALTDTSRLRTLVTCPFSTGAVTAPASGPSLRPGGHHQAGHPHCRGRGRAHVHAGGLECVGPDFARQGAQAGCVAASLAGDARILPDASSPRRDAAWPSCRPQGACVGADPATGARRDPLATTASSSMAGVVVAAGSVHRVTRRRLVVEHRQRLLRPLPVSAGDLAVGRRARLSAPRVGVRADVSSLAGVAA